MSAVYTVQTYELYGIDAGLGRLWCGGVWEGVHNKSSALLALDKVPDFEQLLFLTELLSELGFCVHLTIGERR